MSFQLNSYVPVLDGTNYQQWAAAMQSYLMSQGQWKCTKTGTTPPLVTTTETDGTTYTTGQEDLDKWNQDSKKAVGNIRLRLHHPWSLSSSFSPKSSMTWEKKKERRTWTQRRSAI